MRSMSPLEGIETPATPIYLSLGERGDLVQAMNALNKASAGVCVVHLFPGEPNLPHEILRGLGKRSEAPGWPSRSGRDWEQEVWSLAEAWLRAEGISDLFVYPAGLLGEELVNKLTELDGLKRLWLATRDGAGIAVSADEFEGGIGERCGVDRDQPRSWESNEPHFDWPEHIFLGRFEALKNFDPKIFLIYDDLWTKVRDRSRLHLLHQQERDDPGRWIRILTTRSDGSTCPVAMAAVVAACIERRAEVPDRLPKSLKFEAAGLSSWGGSASAHLSALVALRSVGFSELEATSLRTSQFSIDAGRLSLMGCVLPEDCSVPIRAQLSRRSSSPGETLFPPRTSRVETEFVNQQLKVSPKCEADPVEIEFRSLPTLDDIAGTEDTACVRWLLKSTSSARQSRCPVERDRIDYLRSIEMIRTYSRDAIVADEPLYFSVDRVRNGSLQVLAQQTRNSAQSVPRKEASTTVRSRGRLPERLAHFAT